MVDFEKDSENIRSQFRSMIFRRSDEAGVILRADSLGSVEALLELLKDKGINVKDAAVGSITKKDLIAAGAVANEDPFLGVVLGFNVNVLDEAREESKQNGVPIIYSNIVYKIIEEYQDWVKEEKDKIKKHAEETLTWPAKIEQLKGYVFRASKPAVFGVEVKQGKLKKGYRLMKSNGEFVGEIKEMQKEKEKVNEAGPGDQLALSCDGIHIGKNVSEGETLYSHMLGHEIKAWQERLDMFNDSEKELFEEIRQIMKRRS